MVEYRGRSNVNSVKRSKAMARPKEQQAGWINVRKKKKKIRETTGKWEKMKRKKKPLVKLIRRKGKIVPFECRVPKNSKER